MLLDYIVAYVDQYAEVHGNEYDSWHDYNAKEQNGNGEGARNMLSQFVWVVPKIEEAVLILLLQEIGCFI